MRRSMHGIWCIRRCVQRGTLSSRWAQLPNTRVGEVGERLHANEKSLPRRPYALHAYPSLSVILTDLALTFEGRKTYAWMDVSSTRILRGCDQDIPPLPPRLLLVSV